MANGIPNFTAFNLSPNPSYNQRQPDGSTQVLEGVELGGDTYGYCLENEMTSTMMGDFNDATVLSQEACEGRIGEAQSGALSSSLFEAWGLDAPGATNVKEDAREVGAPAIEALEPRTTEDTASPNASAPSSSGGASSTRNESSASNPSTASSNSSPAAETTKNADSDKGSK